MYARGFLRLLKKYRDGTLPADKRALMDRWYEVVGKDRETAEEQDKSALKERIWEGFLLKTSDSITDPTDDPRTEESGRFFNRALIASIVCVLAAGVFLYHHSVRENPTLPLAGGVEKAGWQLVENTTQVSKEVMLPDGSRVVLESGGRLEYPEVFEPTSRTVLTQGNVFFEVTKDEQRPFLALAGDVHVRVLGTSFTIKELDQSSATEVAVISGKVTVEKAQRVGNRASTASVENRVVLTPNRKVTFFKDSDHYVTGLVENPVFFEKADKSVRVEAFDFDDEPLRLILGKLEKAYGVHIVVDDENVLDCRITADLTSDNIYGKVEVISAILNAQYEVSGTTIRLSHCLCSEL